MKTPSTDSDRNALAKAISIIGRSPKAQTLHEAATDVRNPEAVANLGELVRGDFARLASGGGTSAGVEPTGDVSEAQESAEIDARLMPLVVQPINALSEAKRTVRGRVCSGEEIARAIPDVAAFLQEVDLQKEDGILLDFFELNEAGQLVMKDDCAEAYGRDENFLQAKIRQTRIVYRGEDGQTHVMAGQEYFNITKRDEEGRPLEMQMSEAAQKINLQSVLMVRGLPFLKCNDENHTGEYARMNIGQFERSTCTWINDDSLNASQARYAGWDDYRGGVDSFVDFSDYRYRSLGSRGVLRVNLKLES